MVSFIDAAVTDKVALALRRQVEQSGRDWTAAQNI